MLKFTLQVLVLSLLFSCSKERMKNLLCSPGNELRNTFNTSDTSNFKRLARKINNRENILVNVDKMIRLADESKHVPAYLFLATLYYEGKFVDKDLVLAEKYYLLHARSSKPPHDSFFILGKISETNANFLAAFNYYNDGVAISDVRCIIRLAEFYDHGIHVKKNTKKANNLYLMAVNLYDYNSASLLTKRYYRGGLKYFSQEDIRKIISVAADNSDKRDPLACFLYGRSFHEGSFTEINHELAVKYLTIAGSNGIKNSYPFLVEAYFSGKGTKRYMVLANYWINKMLAINNKDAYAMYLKSLIYRYGMGVDRDLKRSFRFEQKADAEGINKNNARVRLAKLYLSGKFIEYNPELALMWLEKAAREDYTPANLLLGEIYHTGNHINRDLDLAKKYTEMAAKDSIDAAYNLSLLYMETDANYYDLEKSRAWAEIAAKKGYKPAQTQLGHMYLYGQGGVQSNVKAFAWLYIANESKYNDSEQENFELSKHMTLNERKRAIRLSNLYKKLYNL